MTTNHMISHRAPRRRGLVCLWSLAGATTLAGLLVACSGGSRNEDAANPEDHAAPSTPSDGKPVETSSEAPLPVPEVTKTSLREIPALEAWAFASDAPAATKMDKGQAEARGLTLVDLSDDWVPFIFSAKTPGKEDVAPNDYAKLFIALANDKTDEDGRSLGASEHNYLELYGISPSLSVVLADMQRAEDEVAPCLQQAGFDPAPLQAFKGTIAFSNKSKKLGSKAGWYRKKLQEGLRKAGKPSDDLSAAATLPELKSLYASYQEEQLPLDVLEQVSIRLTCEGHLTPAKKGSKRPVAGVFDATTHHALASFERKHALMGWGHITQENLPTLAAAPQANAHARLRRVITERVISARGILEDGSAATALPNFRWRDAQGQEHPLPNMVDDSVQAALAALHLDDPTTARKRLEEVAKTSGEGLSRLLIAVKLPALPEYYSANMDFHTVIDRGDVWYDFPWTEEGKAVAQPRSRYPKITLFVRYEGQDIPLVVWRTTIGSWRSELKDGKEYYAYKNSDVGPRVWKTIMAAPVWIPPDGTPTRALVKPRVVDGKFRTAVNYDETGPGYKSAYGLVAAYHVQLQTNKNGDEIEIDNQIRTHGSVDYMSILRRYSHGCHRLYNMNAVRMFSFVLAHRDFVREGQTKIGFARNFEHEGRSFHMALRTRGYRYELVEPIPVEVLEGRIRGTRQSPIKEFLPKPGVDYTTDEDTMLVP